MTLPQAATLLHLLHGVLLICRASPRQMPTLESCRAKTRLQNGYLYGENNLSPRTYCIKLIALGFDVDAVQVSSDHNRHRVGLTLARFVSDESL